MSDIAESRLLDALSRIRAETEWGKNQNTASSFQFLLSEINELKEAISRKDNTNIAEEIGDCLMMLFFLFIILQEKSEISFDQLLDHVSRKLENRYLTLFQKRSLQLLLFEDIAEFISKDEKKTWYDQKKSEKILEFAYCSNNQCIAFLEPGSSSLNLIRKGTLNIKCDACGNLFPIESACLFANIKKDKLLILSTIHKLIQSENSNNQYKFPKISRATLQKALQMDHDQMLVLRKLLWKRYNFNDLEKLKSLVLQTQT